MYTRATLCVQYTDRANPIEKHVKTMNELFEPATSPVAAQIFANAGLEHMKKYGYF